mgnify:CR=1 FL=1
MAPAATAGAQDAEEKAPGLRVATFDMDVTPPIGTQMAYDPVKKKWDLGLRGRGIVLMGAGDPIVLCAMDWIGIGNGAYDAFQEALAKAAGTTPERVAVHCLHQHDSPMCDFTAEKILEEAGIAPDKFESDFHRNALQRLAARVKASLDSTQPVTHVGTGKAEVEKVASNRRILGEDGKVRAVRFTTCRDPEVRAEPEGTIDPELSMVSFWNGKAPVAVLTYYATHPQSYYRTGIPNPDFPGIARFMHELEVPQALHVHFTGAGANIGAGKYNDGSKENRGILARRVADAMRRAWKSTEKHPITAEDVDWRLTMPTLPLAPHLKVEELEATLEKKPEDADLVRTARHLAWARRCEAGDGIEVSCLEVGPAQLVHMPAELFVEYQLAAKEMRPDKFVAMAAYGDYAPGYICTTVAYDEGGYEPGKDASRVAPEVEPVLMSAMEKVLKP